MPDVAPSYADPVSNLRAAETRLKSALRGAGRPETAAKVVAISKTQSADRIGLLIDAGHRVFGENRVQEAEAKWPALRTRHADLELHLVGPLQTNKVKEAVALFDVIETLDRERLARALADEMERQNKMVRIFVQVNTGEEPQKAGIAPLEADAFITSCRAEFGLKIEGLMCIPPADEAPAPHFALLARIARRNGLKGLSMGMSADYAVAASLGATLVRLGTEIFGPRV